MFGTRDTIRWGADAGNTIGVPYASTVTAGAAVCVEVVVLDWLFPLCPQAVSMTRKKNNKRTKREEMTRERIELNLQDKKTPAVTSRGLEVNQKT
jgi:hypothetical protein